MVRHQLARFSSVLTVVMVVAALLAVPLAQAPARKAPEHATRAKRLLIANAMVVYGNAKPAFGPMDILSRTT